MVVIDTCVMTWDALEPKKLSAKAKKTIEEVDQKSNLIISDISIWEISMLLKKGRIQVDETPANLINTILIARNYIVKSISPEIAELSVNLNHEINNDPADRLIVATSILENFPLVTADKNLIDAKIVETIW
ncbi:MAG: type II toxin-antitoxin system VapC family toxin [Cyanobacteria bacterium J06639_18]